MNPIAIVAIGGAGLFVIGKLLSFISNRSGVRDKNGRPASSSSLPPTDPTRQEDEEETNQLVEEELKKETIKRLPESLPVPSFLETINQPGIPFQNAGLVTREEWSRYVKTVRSAGQATISPNYNLGMFLINMRTLQDFDYVKNVRKQDYKGKSVWKGEWAGPYSLEKFLADGVLQYEVFLKLTRAQLPTIVKKYGTGGMDILYKEVESKSTVTLSGLLAVAKFAGLGGLDKWVKGDKKAATTAAFEKSNGIF